LPGEIEPLYAPANQKLTFLYQKYREKAIVYLAKTLKFYNSNRFLCHKDVLFFAALLFWVHFKELMFFSNIILWLQLKKLQFGKVCIPWHSFGGKLNYGCYFQQSNGSRQLQPIAIYRLVIIIRNESQ